MSLNLFETTLKLKGFPIKEAKKRVQEIQSIPEEEYQDYISEQKERIVSHHLRENNFYKQFSGLEHFRSWDAVPVMTKADLQKPLAERLSSGFSAKNVYVNKTSGSSGHPFVFAKDTMCHALTWAEIMSRFEWHGINFNNALQARFYGIPLDRLGYQKERLKDKLSNRFRFPIFDLSDEKFDEFLGTFKTKPFTYINGYTSAIVLFAKFLQKRNYNLKDICPTLTCCIVTSEMLYDTDKKLMETVFGIPVYNEYGASELDLIAFENKNDEFVLNSETLFVEILDDHDQPVPNGLPGRIVITSLYNKAHPMIRYDIGDSGIIAKGSTLKKPILEKLIGRTNDVAKLPSGKQVPGLTFYYVTKSVIEDDGNVKEFVIEQIAIDHFTIMYVADEVLTTNETQKIIKAVLTYLEEGLTVSFKKVTVLDRANRGKLKQFISRV
ncbi:possible capK protein [unidentified eubacterium SCB49]|nr:possible capK protein [unidentified eubacterium SCB49]